MALVWLAWRHITSSPGITSHWDAPHPPWISLGSFLSSTGWGGWFSYSETEGIIRTGKKLKTSNTHRLGWEHSSPAHRRPTVWPTSVRPGWSRGPSSPAPSGWPAWFLHHQSLGLGAGETQAGAAELDHNRKEHWRDFYASRELSAHHLGKISSAWRY